MGHSLKIHSHLSTLSLFFPLFQTCSCSWSFSLSRLLFITAPSLKCLVVPKVTCHRRSRNQTYQSSLPCIYTNTDNLLSNRETPGDHQTLLHLWERFCLPWHTRTSGVHTGLSVKLQHPTPKRLFLLWHQVSTIRPRTVGQTHAWHVLLGTKGSVCSAEHSWLQDLCSSAKNRVHWISEQRILDQTLAGLKIDSFCWCVLHSISFKCPDVSTWKHSSKLYQGLSTLKKKSNMNCYFQHRGKF